jgi:CRISPR-associated endonuclease/helicase Cas3
MTDASWRHDYAEFFRRATGGADGYAPHAYQVRIGTGTRLPDLVEIPPGYGKTAAIVLAWIWRRLYCPDPSVRAATPRRLIIALPMRSLTDQVAGQVAVWLDHLGLTADQLGMHVIMGGRSRAAKPWREAPEQPSILIGTIDLITSKALVRAYGTPRHAFPMDAALVWNDAHIVVDEVQQAPATTVTLRQLDAFRAQAAVGNVGLTCMSATVPREIIDTVDNPWPHESHIVRLGAGDDTVDLARRRAAIRTVRQVEATPGDARAIAAHLVERHRPGTRTLAVVNTVRAAREVERALRRTNPSVEIVLLHSQFRPVDRVERMQALTVDRPPDAGIIIVATQVVEAGIDVDADVMLTEVAPWSSVVQRSGRCNRRGIVDDAELWWIRPAKPAPYEPDDIDHGERALLSLEGRQVTNEDLLARKVATKPPMPAVLRRADFLNLFDTSPDLTGHDLDIAPYVRDGEDLSVQICWMSWDGVAPPVDIRPLDMDLRCRVPVREVAALLKADRPIWRFDPVAAAWRRVDSRTPARPGELLLMHVGSGGYRTDVGFDPTSGAVVPLPDVALGLDVPAEDAADADAQTFIGTWVGLDQHLTEAEEEARLLITDLDLPAEQAADVLLAARVHDVGKAHPTWQNALCNTADESEQEEVASGRPWAKSSKRRSRLSYGNGIKSFRHELAGVALLDGPLSDLLDQAHDPDLVRYLVLAHHGKLRVQVREIDPSRPQTLYGLTEGAEVPIPAVLGRRPTALRPALARFRLGGAPESGIPGWPDVVAGLLQRYGVFRLAYLEALVRVADWRASVLHDQRQERP